MSIEGRRSPFYLGIDLGGTFIKSGVVDDKGDPLSSVCVPTNAEQGPEAGLDSLVEAGHRAVAASGLSWKDIAAVGIGSPGTMDIPAGMLLDPPNLPGWRISRSATASRKGSAADRPPERRQRGSLRRILGRGRPRCRRAWSCSRSGTGIGGGIVVDGRLIEGRHSHGAECGHIIIQMEGGRRCSCGAVRPPRGLRLRHGAGEAGRGGPGAGELFARGHARGRHPDGRGHRPGGRCRRHRWPRRLMHETAHYLAVGAVSLMHTIDPDLVLFAGGMIAAGEEFLRRSATMFGGWRSPLPPLGPASSTRPWAVTPVSSAPPGSAQFHNP